MTATDYGTLQQRLYEIHSEIDHAKELLYKIDHAPPSGGREAQQRDRARAEVVSRLTELGEEFKEASETCNVARMAQLQREWAASERAARIRQRVQAFEQHLRKTPEKDWPPEDWYGHQA